LLAIGANLSGQKDSPKEQVAAGMALLAAFGFEYITQSRLFRTPCFPAGAGPDFVNAAVICQTAHTPEDTLHVLHRIEADLGRKRGARWGARVIDIDLLAHGDAVWPDLATYRHWAGLPLAEQARQTPDRLILPHPRLQDRGFVLVPLMDVAPDWRHPVLGRTVRQMHDALDPESLAQIWPLNT